MDKLSEEFRDIETIINEESFLENKGLGNEVAYYVYDYPASKEIIVRNEVNRLKQKYDIGKRSVEIVHIDLYDIVIDYVEDLGLLEACYAMEKEHGFGFLHESLTDLLKMDSDYNFFVEYIFNKTKDKSNDIVVLVTGIGKIFPIIRAHNILNKLHLNFDTAPVIFFYPGKYDGQSFVLYNEIKDENYYRAFPLNEILKNLGGNNNVN